MLVLLALTLVAVPAGRRLGTGLDLLLERMDACDGHLGRHSSCPSFFFSMISVEEPTFQVWGDVTYVYLFLC